MWGTPPEPGTAELEPGEFLAYHYTSSDEALSSILREGVKLDTSERRPTEEAAAVWGSFERPQGFKHYVEFKVRREDMWVGQPSSDEDMARAAQMGHNFTMVKNEIPVDRITTWSSPEIEDVRVWQRELADATPEWKKSVLNGAYDGVPAVDKAKQVLAKEFGSPGWAEKPSGVTDGAAIKRVSVPRVDTDRLQRRADRLRREIDDPDFVYPGARMGFRHRAAELTKIESELVKRGALEPEARRTSVVAGLIPLVSAGCQSAECAPPPVGVGGSSKGGGAAAVMVPNPVTELNGLPDEVAQAVEAARRKLGALDVHESEEATALIKESYDRAGGTLEYAFDQGLDRSSLVKAVLGIERVGFNPGGDPNWLEPTVELMAKRTRATLLGAGFMLDDRIALYRGVYDSSVDPFRMDPDGLDPEEQQGGVSGITSWTTSPKLAGMYGTSLIVAAVPVRQILSWDQVGVQISRFGMGNEVLVAPESMVTNVLEGVFPAGKRIYPSQVASGVVELACRDASCAPPPVGTGGSSPAQGLVDGRERVVQMVENVRAGDPLALMHARNIMSAREQVLGFHELDAGNPELDAGMKAEWSALAKVVPVEDGFVRRGSEGAAALIAEVSAVLPSATVGQFQDVHPEAVRALLQGVAVYPAEVRAYVKGVALGYTEAESHVAAFGPHGGGLMGPAAPGATLWLGPKAVRPAVGGANPDGASVMATVDGYNRHRLVGAHEMGHVVHNMAAERAWKEDGRRIDLRSDPLLPEGVPTSRYGGLDTGEMVAETFALAARDTFKSLEPLQQEVIVGVLDRAGLKPTDLAFAVADETPYEIQFFGDDFGLADEEPEGGRRGSSAAGRMSTPCRPRV